MFCRGAVRRTGEFVFCRGAARRTGEFVSCRGAASRTGEFAAGYAAHVPGGTASGKKDAADAFPPRAKGRTAKSLRPAAAAPGLPYVHEYTFASIRRRSRLTLFCLFPRRAIMSVPRYAENLPFSRRRWRGAGISANYFVICVVKTTEFGFSETKLSVRCAAADGFTRRRRSVRQTEKKPRR